ncbi:MAG TPA: hypothetical protein VHS28_04360, partial [Chloroflexota bacterium]|nr:hypothetical protein [Chloroflexota bacterium]
MKHRFPHIAQEYPLCRPCRGVVVEDTALEPLVDEVVVVLIPYRLAGGKAPELHIDQRQKFG